MREQTAEEILTVVKRAVERINLTMLEVADKVGVKTASIRPIGEDVDWEAMKRACLADPEPSPEQKKADLQSIKAGPHLFRSNLLHCLKQINYHPGGHPRALPPEQEVDACKMVEKYRIEEHMDTAAAIDRVAIELNWHNRVVSPRTLRRRYNEYVKKKRMKKED